MSNDHGITYLELTDAESRLIRATLEHAEKTNGRASGENALTAYNRGIIRGTERLAREAVEKRKAKRT